MITNADELRKLYEFTRQAKEKGYSAEEVNGFLKSKGSDLEEMSIVGEYGADNIVKARQAVKDVDLPDHTAEIAKESIKGGLRGALEGAERVASGMTMGGYDWATKKIADATGIEDIDSGKRWEESKKTAGEQNKALRDIMSVAGGVNEFGGALLNPMNKMFSGATTFGGKVAQGAGAGGLYGGLSSAFESDFDADKTLSGLKTGAVIGGLAPVAVEGAKILGKNILGMTTGAGEKSFEQAYDAGKRGSKDFKDAMRGKIEETEVVSDLENELRNMQDKASKAYDSGMNKIANNKIDFNSISDDFDDIAKSAMVGKTSTMSESRSNIYDKAKRELKKFMKDPSAQNVKGADALKKNIRDINVSMDDKAGLHMRTKLTNLVEDKIKSVSPEYSKVMKEYGKTAGLINDVEKELSAGNGKKAMQTLGKLQSITRDTTSSRYGARSNLIDQLSNKQQIYDKVSGMMFDKWTPRGLSGAVMGSGALSGAIANPTVAIPALGSLLATSPRLMGELTYGLGRASNYAPSLAQVLAGSSVLKGE